MQLAKDWNNAFNILKGQAGVGIPLSYGECANSITEQYYLQSIKTFDKWFNAATNIRVLQSLEKFLDGLFNPKHSKIIYDEALLLLSKVQEIEGTHVGQTRVIRLKLEHGTRYLEENELQQSLLVF